MHAPLPSPVLWRVPGRVAFINGNDSPSNTTNHAAAIQNLAIQLQVQGHSVIVLDSAPTPSKPWKQTDSIRYIYTNYYRSNNERERNLIYTLLVFKPSIVVADFSSIDASSSMRAARSLAIPFIMRVSELPAESNHHSHWKYDIFSQTDAILSESEAIDRWLLSIGVRASAIIKLHAKNNDKTLTTSNLSEWIKKIPTKPNIISTSKSTLLIDRFLSGSIRVATVMDEFTYNSYAPECDILQLTPDNSIAELEHFQPELLFIESAWRGKDDLWGSKVGHKSSELIAAVQWCRARSIPTIFWNKEDPVHFETFLSTAKLFDCVFTTDIDCIHRYKAALGHNEVYLLPFACQPQANNPIEKYERKDAFCFAGAYYVRYPERTRDLGNFIEHLPRYRPVEIYDRNHGKEDTNYMFPETYRPFIVGNLPYTQIDKAYKGYKYAINLNSIKQSQSMFARRIFELLACNTIAISNFSRGVRLLFGDLVVTSDNGEEIVRRLEKLGNESYARRYRLAGLRKVMQNHTYEDRLAYIISKVDKTHTPLLHPHICVTGYANDIEQLNTLIAAFNRQTYMHSSLAIVTADDLTLPSDILNPSITLYKAQDSISRRFADLTGHPKYIAGMVASDYYGPNYILDLALATRYTNASTIGKASYYSAELSSEEPKASNISLINDGRQYQFISSVKARCSLIKTSELAQQLHHEWLKQLSSLEITEPNVFSIDEFNYCKNGEKLHLNNLTAVDDLTCLDCGISDQELKLRSEGIEQAQSNEDDAPTLSAQELARYFNPPRDRKYSFELGATGWHVTSDLADNQHDYIYASQDLRPEELNYKDTARIFLDLTPGLNLQIVMLFLDDKKQRISSIVKSANRNHEHIIPPGTEWIRLGIRLYGSGSTEIKRLVLGHRTLRPSEVIGRAKHLVLTNHYPSNEDLYRNGFVHTRIAAYAERGVKADVFRLRKDHALSYHEFHDIDVITGCQESLGKLLNSGRYESVLVHFLDPAMWEVLEPHINNIKITIWVHGAEIQPWHRREYMYENEEELNSGKILSDLRMKFWRNLLQRMHHNIKLVFVSQYFAEEIMEDLGFRLPEDSYKIIHNPIDTELFSYQRKPVEQRMKILSIRPYASKTYANDLSVAAILHLSKESFFSKLSFHLIGDGKLFEETVLPLRHFENVKIERKFLTRNEIALLHKDYGLFLCPTRMDTQGVSRDEAMSSGLIPVTNFVAAIPEFVNESCGLLAPAEDYVAIAEKIAYIVNNPTEFDKMSQSAAARVRNQSSASEVVCQELQLFAMDKN